ncbi:MAG: hypothetical protein DI609_00445 [Corynebacterium urealyticum]|uniref:Uncharacterized protein n=1 Tax=Corynebacterium urealyticum TaxID=43771 RepID=A0A2W5BED6_9CORY|nr:MAG: hypothetical protein DI609_00445 [Corynebacterium urealyticum]
MNQWQLESMSRLSRAVDSAMEAVTAQRDFLVSGSDEAAERAEAARAAYDELAQYLDTSGEEDSLIRLLESDITNGDVEAVDRIRGILLRDRVREYARGNEVDELINRLEDRAAALNRVVAVLKELRGW